MARDDEAFAQVMTPQRCADEIESDYAICKAAFLCAKLQPEPAPYARCLGAVRNQAAPPQGWVPRLKRTP